VSAVPPCMINVTRNQSDVSLSCVDRCVIANYSLHLSVLALLRLHACTNHTVRKMPLCFKHHAMKMYLGLGVKFHAFLVSALHRDVQPASCFPSGVKAPLYPLETSFVDPRASLDAAVDK
jgi:hypothetical protein